MKLLIINGPNLNLLGKRDRSLYGSLGLDEIENKLNSEAEKLKINIEFFQSNHEGNIVDFLQSNSLSKFIYSLTFSITGSIINASLPFPDEIKYVYVEEFVSNNCLKII